MRSLRLLRAGAGCAALLALPAAPALASEGGIVLIPQWPLLLPLLVLFGVLILPVQQLIFKPIFRVLDEREQRIAGARERAESVGREADAILARYESEVRQAREEIEARRRVGLEEVRKEHRERTAAARTAAESQLARTRDEIDAALDETRVALRGETEALARVAAERILGRSFA